MQFHDQLLNELPVLKGNWNFSFKIFRNNPYSIPPEKALELLQSDESKCLHTWSPSYLPGTGVALINKSSSCVFSQVIAEEAGNENVEFTIPDAHLHQGATTGLNDPFDYFVAQKLQSMWTQRQTVKGDGGEIYELENERVIIRTSNVFLHGVFKGLLIQIEIPSITTADATVFEPGIQRYRIPQGRICAEVLDPNLLDKYGDLCLQLAEILNF